PTQEMKNGLFVRDTDVTFWSGFERFLGRLIATIPSGARNDNRPPTLSRAAPRIRVPDGANGCSRGSHCAGPAAVAVHYSRRLGLAFDGRLGRGYLVGGTRQSEVPIGKPAGSSGVDDIVPAIPVHPVACPGTARGRNPSEESYVPSLSLAGTCPCGT